MNRDIAEQTSLLAHEIGLKLNRHIDVMAQGCSEKEFQTYVQGIAKVISSLHSNLMVPIYQEHPELKPIQMGGTYQMPKSNEK